jgi:DNA-binding XRE family transcriptional regulator
VSPSQQVATHLVAWRVEHHMTQYDLATAMTEQGITWYQATVSKIEKGKRELYLNEAVALARIVGQSLDALVT